MKAKEIRELSAEEIQSRISEEREQLAQLKFQHAIADLQNPLVLRQKRRLVAQLETILRERLEETTTA
jgi:large subunit ribosomal protein L29